MGCGGGLARLRQPEGEARPPGGWRGVGAPPRSPGGALRWDFPGLGELQGVPPPNPALWVSPRRDATWERKNCRALLLSSVAPSAPEIQLLSVNMFQQLL